jgi:hypothetical protein
MLQILSQMLQLKAYQRSVFFQNLTNFSFPITLHWLSLNTITNAFTRALQIAKGTTFSVANWSSFNEATQTNSISQILSVSIILSTPSAWSALHQTILSYWKCVISYHYNTGSSGCGAGWSNTKVPRSTIRHDPFILFQLLSLSSSCFPRDYLWKNRFVFVTPIIWSAWIHIKILIR